MRCFEAVFQDGAFWPRDHVSLESGSCVLLELKSVDAPRTQRTDNAKWRWSSENLSDLEAAVLHVLGDRVTVRNLEEIERRAAKSMTDLKGDTVERNDIKRALGDLMRSGYIEASIEPATLRGYRITAMGKVCAILSRREQVTRWREAQELPFRPYPPLPDLEVFVSSFEDLDIAFLELGQRISNILKAKGYETVGSICRLTLEQLRQIDRIGPESIDTISFKLEQLGLALKADSSGS